MSISGIPDPGAISAVREGMRAVDARIELSGLLPGSAYTAADEIARVDGDQVHPAKDQDELITS